MLQLNPLTGAAKPDLYADLAVQLAAITEGERDAIANTANAAALIYHQLDNLNWAGFYFLKGSELVLGPFQGKPACIRIAVGRGVCGTAAETLCTQVVHDVDLFPGHIACDSASRSEIVVPIVHEGRLVGVLDVDSPSVGRFDVEDGAGVESFVRVLVAATDFPYHG